MDLGALAASPCCAPLGEAPGHHSGAVENPGMEGVVMVFGMAMGVVYHTYTMVIYIHIRVNYNDLTTLPHWNHG